MTTSVTLPAVQSDSSDVGRTTHITSRLVNVEQTCSADKGWVEGFEIPWTKCRPTLVESLNCHTIPSAADIRELVTHTMSDVFVHTRRPSRKELRCVAQKIVQKRPTSFADYINGKMVDDGVNSLMLMLESRKENLNRRHRQSCGDDQEVSKKKPSKSITGSQMAVLDDDTQTKMEEKRQQLCQYYDSRNLVDNSEIDRCMLITYPYQRYHINGDMPVPELLQKWPFLGESKYLLLHFKYLTTVDIDSILRSIITTKCEVLYSFMAANSTVTKRVIQIMNSLSKTQWPLYFLPLIMAYFREDVGHLLHFFPVCKIRVMFSFGWKWCR